MTILSEMKMKQTVSDRRLLSTCLCTFPWCSWLLPEACEVSYFTVSSLHASSLSSPPCLPNLLSVYSIKPAHFPFCHPFLACSCTLPPSSTTSPPPAPLVLPRPRPLLPPSLPAPSPPQLSSSFDSLLLTSSVHLRGFLPRLHQRDLQEV